jgi:outer membrane lipoprotein-sorting protein
MRFRIAAACAATLAVGLSCLSSGCVQARVLTRAQDDASTVEKAELKPEVAALLKQSTAVYSAMKSYRHVSEYIIKGQNQEGEINRTLTYTLALERPNKFCYKSDEANGDAAVSDGKTFINHRVDNPTSEREHTYFTKTAAPASYKGINIVDDVTFTYGTYMVALMLQGNALADKDVRTAMEQATLKPGVVDNGKKYDLLSAPFMDTTLHRTRPILFYFDATTHLLHKTVDAQGGDSTQRTGLKLTEIIENVQIDKPIPASTFEYKPPKNARLIVSLPARTRSQIARTYDPHSSSGDRHSFNLGASF